MPLFCFGFVIVDLSSSGFSSPFLMLALFVGLPIAIVKVFMICLSKLEAYTTDKIRSEKLKRLIVRNS
jgi:hypothetical protein